MTETSTKEVNILPPSSERGGLFKIDANFTVWVLALIPVAFASLTISFKDITYIKTFGLSFALALILYKLNDAMIPQVKDLLLNAGLGGKDLNKPGEMKDKKPMYFSIKNYEKS